MRILKKLGEYLKSVNELEYTISDNKKSYLEIYERNVILEKEIEQRTRELDQANKTFLNLQNIWDMMNSSQPLSNVLDNIVENLIGSLGYIHSIIIQVNEDESGKYFLTKSTAKSQFMKALNDVIDFKPGTLRLSYNQDNLSVKAMTERKIYHTSDCVSFAKTILPGYDEDSIKRFYRLTNCESIYAVPIIPKNIRFGCLIVYSSREIATETEMTFLSLFARQIELAITIADLFETVKKQAVTDPLTGLYNRRYFEESITKEAERSLRSNQPFSVISLDLDYLKKINDKFGHNYGDIAIQTIAEILKKNARTIDIASRYGGEEFNVLLPGIDSKGAMIAAERIRSSIESEKIDVIKQITASIGVATFLEHAKSVDALLELADQAMYKAKINGRNQVQSAKVISDTSWQEVALEAFLDILSKQRIPISKDIAEKLADKLEAVNSTTQNSKDVLYNIVDVLSQTYNLNHESGITKQKVKTAINLARSYNLDKDQTDKLQIAILLYDIGNIMLPEEIFKKAGPLNEDEIKKVQTHPMIAAREILKPISNIADVIPIIEHHHENWDGTGYPFKTKGEEIPVTSQIILLVDSYYALIQNRSYRSKLSKENALKEITKLSGSKWSNELVNKFVNIINEEENE